MHSVSDDINQIDRRVVESSDLLGKECVGCRRVLAYSFYDKDSSYRDGHKDLCSSCQSSPRLSVKEHTARLNELNYSSEAVRKQRWGKDQLDYMVVDEARWCHKMHYTELFRKLRECTNKLFITPGRIYGDYAVFRIFDQPQEELKDTANSQAKYMFYIPTKPPSTDIGGFLPEFSIIEFDSRDVPVREKHRGWRTVLLKLIKADVITEDKVNEVFGRTTCESSGPYNKQLYEKRNTESCPNLIKE